MPTNELINVISLEPPDSVFDQRCALPANCNSKLTVTFYCFHRAVLCFKSNTTRRVFFLFPFLFPFSSIFVLKDKVEISPPALCEENSVFMPNRKMLSFVFARLYWN